MKDHVIRANELLRQMTIQEKAAQLCSAWLAINEDGTFSVKSISGEASETQSTSKKILGSGIGQITRPFGTRPIEPEAGARGVNALQKFLVEETRLGIPAILHEECLAGVMAKGATQFPTGINYGSTWDDALIREAADVIGAELTALGARQGLSPVLDVARDARWGRTEESFGEDPYLVGILTSAYVAGLQGNKRRLLATLKHYVGHSFSEGGRNHAPVRVGPRELNDLFCLPFEMAVKLSDAGSVMPAYHDIDGEPCSSSRQLVNNLLREQWGFDGLVVADYEALSQLKSDHKTAKDMAEAAAASLKAGMDVELPNDTCFRTGLTDALDRGLVTEEDINDAVRRVLIEKFRLGLFDNPYIPEGPIEISSKKHRETARRTAEKSFVLLRNDGTLPLKDSGRIAVIGPLADDPLAMFCGYSFPAHLMGGFEQQETIPDEAKTLLQAVTDYAGNAEVSYARGCDLIAERANEAVFFPGDIQQQEKKAGQLVSLDTSGFAEAEQTAKQADTVVLALGDMAGLFRHGTVGEGSDAASLRLPGVQQELLERMLDTGKPVVVILINGRPYNLKEGYKRAAAVIEAWLPGETGGEALARTIFGEVSPGGKLPVSIPSDAGAMPYAYNHKPKAAGVPPQEEFGALYPFGYGLSYTEFSVTQCELSGDVFPADGEITVSCTVENTGKYCGDEVLQLYVRDLYASVVRPGKELKGFTRVSLHPKEKKRVTFRLPVDMLSFTKHPMKRVVEPGDFEIQLGSSSEDIIFQKTVAVEGSECRELPEDWNMWCQADISRL